MIIALILTYLDKRVTYLHKYPILHKRPGLVFKTISDPFSMFNFRICKQVLENHITIWFYMISMKYVIGKISVIMGKMKQLSLT